MSCTYYKKENKLIGEFECSCEFKYTRRGPDENNENIYKITKIKDRGNLWYKKLRELVVGELHTVKEIAQILGTDTGTVYRQAKRLVLPIYKRIDNDYEITDNSCYKKKFENRKNIELNGLN